MLLSTTNVITCAVNYLGRVTVKPLSTLGYYQLTMLAKPIADRAIYQLIKKNKFQSFLEIGLGTGDRCQQILRVADKFGNKPIRYTGILSLIHI